VINKVYVEKYERVKKAVEKGLDNLGIRCLGVIPYKKELTFPTVRQLREELSYDVLCGGSYMDGKVCDIIVAAMEPQNMVDYLSDGCLVVVPGDRVDNIVTSINAHLMRKRAATSKIAGLLLTGGLMPHLSIVNLLCQVDVPVLLSKEDTATTAYRVRELVAKITPRDHDKLQMAGDLIRQNIDIDRIFESCE
jgi:BioD-like phosphotransacetylase family protein